MIVEKLLIMMDVNVFGNLSVVGKSKGEDMIHYWLLKKTHVLLLASGQICIFVELIDGPPSNMLRCL